MARVCRMPTIALVAFQDRPGNFIFVRVPDEQGRYLRTHICVAHVACPHCKVTVGEPCKHKGNYHGSTHVMRHHAFASHRRAYGVIKNDLIDDCDGANITVKDAAA